MKTNRDVPYASQWGGETERPPVHVELPPVRGGAWKPLLRVSLGILFFMLLGALLIPLITS